MKKFPFTFSRSWPQLSLLLGLIALAAVLPAAAGAAGSKNVRTATVVKRAATSSPRADTDKDGLSDATELRRTRTSPHKFDSDGDGFGDGAEVAAGTNPRDSHSVPSGPPAPPTSPPVVEAPTTPSPPTTPPTAPTRPTTPTQPTPPVDKTAPQTSIETGPAPTITITSVRFQFRASESGASFQCKLDSGTWNNCASPQSYGSLGLGLHTFAVKATDSAGNADASPASQAWTVQAIAPPADTAAPDTSIDAGPSGTTTATSASFQFSSSESGSSFQCRLDSGSWGSCASPQGYSSLTAGSHAFSVKATDAAGNPDASAATRTWTVQAPAPPADTTPPNTTIDSGPTGTTTSTSASFGFSSSESGSSFKCQLDAGAWASCASPKAYSGLAVGSHSFGVKASDGAGNADASAAARTWTVQSAPSEPPPSSPGCTQTLASGASLSNAVGAAAAGAVICLGNGAYSVNATKANKSGMVTIRAAAGASPTLGYSLLNQATNLRFEGLKFTGGIEALGPASKLQFIDNEFTGPFGFHANGQDNSAGTSVTDVLIEGNNLHNLDYTGNQGTANGYGITASNGVARFTIRDNTIKSPASDYIQFASPETAVIDHNTFLGPSLLGSHQDHQDLVQIFGGGQNITFTNNVARNTETQESLLFQEGAFSNVVVENNLFDHDSRGYTCQIYQSKGLVFRNNTVVGSHWGCLFRDLASSAAGSGYQVDHNVFTNTAEGSAISTEGRAGGWGTYDYNVSDDASASGSHSVKNWKPSWNNTTDYTPVGLSFSAGYRP
ncbi:MAG TPA: right-handed parallel beta-helix repeat-containing protein [Solirubrobacterales bacterium]|jgi:hypothetical protein|nr:right-handed parallel beta-helix repeat-containing protein [Solirubrobacterales bacterium]